MMTTNTMPARRLSAERIKRNFLTVAVTGFFALLCCILLFPMLAGFLASLRPGRVLLQKGLALDLDFSTMSFANYEYLFSGGIESLRYFTWYKNSFILTLESVTCVLLTCYFVAYGLSMYDFKLQTLLFFLVISIMCVPFEILMLPLYREVGQLGLADKNIGVILPRLCSASTIFFFRQYMRSLPRELLDSGRIDGCTEYGISVRIMMPLTKPAFASMAIMSAMNTWNDMLWPMLIFRSADKFTLQIGLNTLLTPYGNNYDVLIAGAMFGVLPILIVFLLFQRYLIDGLTAGAVKG
jgi:arabinosaccharide transport system permease protein